MFERWRPIAGHDGFYSVSDLGRIRSEFRAVMRSNGVKRIVSERILSPARKASGHLSVCLYPSGTRMHVHRAVAIAFLGRPPTDLHEVAHSDGDPSNNAVQNLRWATRAENHADKLAHGTHNRGDAHPRVKVSDAVVRRIRSSGLPASRAAKAFGVPLKFASAVILGTTRRFA